MSIQIQLNICRSCLAEDPKLQLTEYSADSDVFKSFQFLINSEPADQKLPTTFCQKCITKIKIAAGFKKLSLESEKYLISLITKINQEFKSSLSNFSGNRQSAGSEDKTTNDYEDQELAYIMDDEEVQKEGISIESQLPSEPTVVVEAQSPKGFKSVRRSSDKLPKLEQVKIEALPTSNQKTFIAASEIYSSATEEDDQPMESDHMFTHDKEIYDIMEIEGNDDIYVDEAGNTILNAEDDEGEFILVNYKSEENDELSNEKEYIVEDGNDDVFTEEEEQHKPTRKKHVQRMPKEIVDRYAQSTESNQHICTKCVKVFSTRTNLIRHIQSHDGNKPYVCEVCKKGFTQSGSLKQHMYIHSGERPYKCNFCDKAFTQGKTLKFHMRRHMDEKPFVCGECSACFRQRDGLKRHLKSRHNVELKFERNNQMNEKIIAFVEMKETDEKTLEIMEDGNENEGTEDKKSSEF